MTTDTRLAVVELNDCRAPRLSTETIDMAPVPIHGGRLELFVRREIRSVRSDLIPNNWYRRSYEVTRWMVGVLREHWRTSAGPRSFLSSFRHSSLPALPMQTAAMAQ